MPGTANTGASVRTDGSVDPGRIRRWPIVATLALSTTVGCAVAVACVVAAVGAVVSGRYLPRRY